MLRIFYSSSHDLQCLAYLACLVFVLPEDWQHCGLFFTELSIAVTKVEDSPKGHDAGPCFCVATSHRNCLLHVVSLLLLRDFGTHFHWTVELLHPLTHVRSVSRHFSLIRHNRTVARASVLWRDIHVNWLIDWWMDWLLFEHLINLHLHYITYE